MAGGPVLSGVGKHPPVNFLWEMGIAPASCSPSNRASGCNCEPSEGTANVSAATCTKWLCPQQSTRKLPSIYAGLVLVFSMFKDGPLPHGRCYVEGRFKFADELPLLLFKNLYFSSLLWKCSLNEAKDATRGFLRHAALSMC